METVNTLAFILMGEVAEVAIKQQMSICREESMRHDSSSITSLSHKKKVFHPGSCMHYLVVR